MNIEWLISFIPFAIAWLSFSIWIHDKQELGKNEIGILIASIGSAVVGVVLLIYLI